MEAVSPAKLSHGRHLQEEKLLLRNNSLAAHKHTQFKSLIYEYMLAEDIKNNKLLYTE